MSEREEMAKWAAEEADSYTGHYRNQLRKIARLLRAAPVDGSRPLCASREMMACDLVLFRDQPHLFTDLCLVEINCENRPQEKRP